MQTVPASTERTPRKRHLLPLTRGELTDEIGCHLEVNSARPISIHLPFSGTLRLNDVWLSRKTESVPLVNALGALMLVKAEKRQTAPKEN